MLSTPVAAAAAAAAAVAAADSSQSTLTPPERPPLRPHPAHITPSLKPAPLPWQPRVAVAAAMVPTASPEQIFIVFRSQFGDAVLIAATVGR